MARKQMIEGGTKNRIREVGGRQIFEHGYDGTSVRGIMLEVGGEVGLFYYYYKTKDELFTDVLDHFFEPYRKDLLHEDADWVDEATDDMRRTVNLIMGLSEEESRKMFEDADGKANAPAAMEGEKENEM